MQKKLLVLFFLVLAAFVGLGVRLFVIGKTNGEAYKKQVLNQQQYDSVTIPYRRGLILDRNDMVLATSEKVYNVILDSNALLQDEKYMEPTMAALKADLKMDTGSIKSYAIDHPESRYYILAKNLTYEEISSFRDKLNDPATYPDIKGIWFEEQYKRQYPNGTLASSVTGFTTSDNSGTGGIEEYYNSVLSGTNGREYGYQNADSNLERTTIAAKDGYTVCSTIDSGVQTIVEEKLTEFNEEYRDKAHTGNGAENVGCIIMEVDSGKVLAMADYPFYDPSEPRNTERMIGMREVDHLGNKTDGESEMLRRLDQPVPADAGSGESEKETASSESSDEKGETETETESGEEGASGGSVREGDASANENANVSENPDPTAGVGVAGLLNGNSAYQIPSGQPAGTVTEGVVPEGLSGTENPLQSGVYSAGQIVKVGDADYITTGYIAPKYVTRESLEMMDSETLYQNYNAIWKNFCISSTYEPGSVAKPFTVASAIDCGAINGDEAYNCEGFLEVGDYEIYCHNVYGDGILNVSQALERSCNVCLMQIAFAEGAEQFTKYQDIFGFGLKTNVDLAGEARTAGLVYSADTIGRTELATNSFGQGFNVTMIQMITGFCSLVNGGNLYQPMLADRIATSDGATIENMQPRIVKQTISKTTSAYIRDCLYQVVFGENGTGKTARPYGYAIGGKTGTAETLPRGNGEYVLSFMGYAPADDPEIAIYVVVDRPNAYVQDDAKFATRIVRSVLQEVLPYLGIYMTEELTEDEKAALAEEGISPIYGDGRSVDMPETETETAQEQEQQVQEAASGSSASQKKDNKSSGNTVEQTPETPVQEEVVPDEPWKDFDIDPATGYAVDPDTGALVDPETGHSVGVPTLNVEDIVPAEPQEGNSQGQEGAQENGQEAVG
ncbi:MAG: cell division protein FtsI [Lachnospiraceae bacterium]|nr:cell division protein FtsI [Lachnospiraceae bacterium]